MITKTDALRVLLGSPDRGRDASRTRKAPCRLGRQTATARFACALSSKCASVLTMEDAAMLGCAFLDACRYPTLGSSFAQRSASVNRSRTASCALRHSSRISPSIAALGALLRAGSRDFGSVR